MVVVCGYQRRVGAVMVQVNSKRVRGEKNEWRRTAVGGLTGNRRGEEGSRRSGRDEDESVRTFKKNLHIQFLLPFFILRNHSYDTSFQKKLYHSNHARD